MRRFGVIEHTACNRPLDNISLLTLISYRVIGKGSVGRRLFPILLRDVFLGRHKRKRVILNSVGKL